LREKQALKYRNPKLETNLNDQRAQIPNKLVSDFEICFLPLIVPVSDFDIRISDLKKVHTGDEI